MDHSFECREPKNSKTADEAIQWIAENSKKPGFGFYELGVKKGQLCGIAIDSMATIGAMSDMAVRILKGEKVKNIKADYPPKSYIFLNQMTAKRLGFVFSPEVIEGAWRVYTDYNGTYTGRD